VHWRQCAQHIEHGRAHPAPFDQHVTISEVAKINPAAALTASLHDPLDAVPAFDHATVAISDNGGIKLVTLPKVVTSPS
jgi:hypothetical protein